MDLIFASLQKLKKHGFNFLQAQKSSKNMDLIFCKLTKALSYGKITLHPWDAVTLIYSNGILNWDDDGTWEKSHGKVQ